MALMLLHKRAGMTLAADTPVLAPDEVAVVCELREVLAQAHQEAAAQLEAARAECAALHAAAAQEIEALRQDAERAAQQALHDAYQQGMTQGREHAAQLLVQAAASAEDQARALESYVVRAVLVGIRTILGQMPADERMRRLVARALAQVEIPGSLSMYVHPDDAAAAAQGIEAMPDGRSMAIRIVADAALPVGACRLQSEFGSVEAGLASQLEVVTQALTAVAGARGLAHPDAPSES